MAGLENSQTHWQRSTDIYCACRFQLSCAWQAGYTFDGEEKGCTAGILVFLFFFPHLRSASVTPYSAICVHNHAHYLYSFMYSSKKEISQHFSRHSQTKRLQHFFFACFTIFLQKYPPAMKSCCFCKHQAMSWNGFHTLGHCTQTWKHTSGDLHSKIIMETWTYRNGESTTKITQWPTLIF